MNANFSFTIYDVVSYLLPGSFFLLTLNQFSELGKNFQNGEGAVILVVAGFLLGAVLHLLGLLLFKPILVDDYEEGSIQHKTIKIIDNFISFFPLIKVKKVDTEGNNARTNENAPRRLSLRD